MLDRLVQEILNLGIPVAKPVVITRLQHDSEAFTQGLAYANGVLYESTGGEAASSIRRLSADTGKAEIVKELDGHWGEGVAVQGDRVIQLTWKGGVGFVYDSNDLSLVDQVSYEGEGWGLAAFMDGFAMTNGSHQLSFRAADFSMKSTAPVLRKGLKLGYLNDLEYARGRFYVHRLGAPYLLELEQESASVNRIIDCSDLVGEQQSLGPDDHFNGVAYNPDEDIFYLTGKRWSQLYKVRIPA